jgi:NAD(P)-dependent dehydrogenase (short-subunit alcohol dehydrogenase family)
MVVASSGRFLRTPIASAYQASKHALIALTDGLFAELAPHGVRVRLVIPGPFRTSFASSLVFHDPEGSVYADQIAGIRAAMEEMDATQEGDPDRAAGLLVEAMAVDRGIDDPVIYLGSEAVLQGERRLRADLSELESSRARAYAADFPS